MSKQALKRNLANFLLFLSIIIADQATKLYFAKLFIEKNQQNPLLTIIPHFLDFTYAQNTGIAFSIDINGWFFNILVGVVLMSLLIVIFFVDWIPFFKGMTERIQKYTIPAILIIGGGFGNLIDRVRLHYVADFIAFSFWPIFNLADSCVTIGTIILIYLLYKNKELG